MTRELDTLKAQHSSLMQAKVAVESSAELQLNDHSTTMAQLQTELAELKEELRAGGARENELKIMFDAQANEMGMTLEKYKVPAIYPLTHWFWYLEN